MLGMAWNRPCIDALSQGGHDMSSSTLDPENFPHGRERKTPKGHDVRALGPSNSSDTGSDLTGLGPLDDTSDREGTGERLGADERRTRPGRDIGIDRVVGADEAGLGTGLDEAEEALRGDDRGEP
jgi:hypothetical protein